MGRLEFGAEAVDLVLKLDDLAIGRGAAELVDLGSFLFLGRWLR